MKVIFALLLVSQASGGFIIKRGMFWASQMYLVQSRHPFGCNNLSFPPNFGQLQYLSVLNQSVKVANVRVADANCTLGSTWSDSQFQYLCYQAGTTVAYKPIACIVPGTNKILAAGYGQSINGIWFQCRTVGSGLLYEMIAAQNCTFGNNTYHLSVKFVVDNVQYQCSFTTAGFTTVTVLQCITNKQTIVPIRRIGGIVQEDIGIAYQCVKVNSSYNLHLLSADEYNLWKQQEQALEAGATVKSVTTSASTSPATTIASRKL